MADKWISGAIPPSHRGRLHRDLHIPEGQKIPEKKILKAEHSDNPAIAKRAHLAETLKKLHRRHGGDV